MSTSERARQPHGRMVDCPGGYRAYVPAPAPPPLEWSESLTLSLSSADRAIGRLAGEGRRLPNPHILIRPFVRREAVLSSRIEGTQATLGELLAAQAGAVVERNPDDLHEVGNYVTALEYGLERLETLPVSLRLVRELHERLMRGVRGEVATPGEFRRSQNWIGPPGSTLNGATYVPPPPSELMPCLDAWERFLHDETLPPLVHAAIAHSQFEAIHPFLDGNGRVGRLLITLLLVARGVIPSPLLYLSAWFQATREEYYARLNGVTARGRVGGVADLLPERRRTPVRRRGGPHRASRRPALRLEAPAGRRQVQAPGARARPLRREPLLDSGRRGRSAGGGVHDGTADHRPAGGGRHRRPAGGGATQPRVLRRSRPRCSGGAIAARRLASQRLAT